MFDDLSTSDVLFLFIEIRSLNNFSYDDEIRQCLMICQHPMSFFSSSRSDHWTISLIMMRFVNVWWFGNIRCPFSLHRDQIIEQFLWRWWDSSMFDDLSTSDVLFLFIEIRSLNNFSEYDEIRQCLMICQHPMSFFSSSRSDHWTISLSRMRFVNVWWFVNIRCPFSLHRDQIIEQFLSRWWDSSMFHDFATSDVLFLFIEMRSLNNFSEDDEIRQCLMIWQHPMSFFSSSRWDHWTISLIIITFVNVWWFRNIRCPFSLHRDEIIEQFLWSSSHSSMFDDWRRGDVPFVLMKMRWVWACRHCECDRKWRWFAVNRIGSSWMLWMRWFSVPVDVNYRSSPASPSEKEFARDPFSSETNSWCHIYNLAMSTSDDFCK